MMQKDKINPFQFLVLVIFFTIGTSILVVPSALATYTRQDAWIASVIGTVIGVFIIWLFTFIGLRFPNLTYVQLNEKVFGKWLGKIFSVIFVILIILLTSSIIVHSRYFFKHSIVA